MTHMPSLLVRKRPLFDEGPVPAVECEVLTDRSEPVEVRLVESLPVGTDQVDVRFHGGTDGWSVRGSDTVAYEGVVQRGAPCRTGYAVATTQRKLRREFMSCPAVSVRDRRGPDGRGWERVDDAVDFRAVESLATMATA
jgi:hypothetical protein